MSAFVFCPAPSISVSSLRSKFLAGSSTAFFSRAESRKSFSTAAKPTSAEWVKVCEESELAEGDRKVTKVDGKPVIVTKQNGKLYAVSATCPHLGLPIKKGKIDPEKCSITCSFHKSEFDLATGRVLVWSESVLGIPGANAIGGILGQLSKEKPLPTYGVKVESGSILVGA
eukprot:EC122336.1.p1 GENE.EC122336.1~~EC122336.1.p1  ORF type:complete len:171 (+),score=22.93 EC122336.1:72-584(+)